MSAFAIEAGVTVCGRAQVEVVNSTFEEVVFPCALEGGGRRGDPLALHSNEPDKGAQHAKEPAEGLARADA